MGSLATFARMRRRRFFADPDFHQAVSLTSDLVERELRLFGVAALIEGELARPEHIKVEALERMPYHLTAPETKVLEEAGIQLPWN